MDVGLDLWLRVFGASPFSVPVHSPHVGEGAAWPRARSGLSAHWESSVLEAAFASWALIDPTADICVDTRRAPVGLGLGPGPRGHRCPRCSRGRHGARRCGCWAAAETLGPCVLWPDLALSWSVLGLQRLCRLSLLIWVISCCMSPSPQRTRSLQEQASCPRPACPPAL